MLTDRNQELTGRVALVTGAAGAGMGGATVRRLAAGGASIVAVDHHARRLEESATLWREEFDVSIRCFVVDIGDRPAVDAMIEEANRELGPVEILVNNAAINIQGFVWDYDPNDFDEVVRIDLNAQWYLMRAVLPGMRELGRGSIINVASIAAWNGGKGRETPYSAAKAGLLEATRSIAIQAGPYGIRCNAVAPGLVWSKFVEKHEERLRADAEATPLRRHGRPEEIANVIGFLASDESSYITGEVINVSGGAYLRP
ncbi:SDR family oxidoreductase [Myxococcota bacterium]|nr:SDR family oxidoreductase [Myxococcota bacterium]